MSTPPAPAEKPLSRVSGGGQPPPRRHPPAGAGDRLPPQALAVADLQGRYPTPVTTDTGHTPMLRTEP